ncbi:MAG: cobalamin B12-binding domain-containing protein [bacterium]|nr:cobalamin B12-binding domain-containing protein [bacterium]
MSTPRVLLAKPGLDGHDRGVKVIAMALRDAGAEVIFLGLRQPPAQIVAAAVQEGADVIGVSVLSGAHLELCRQLVDERSRAGIEDVPIVVGGTIPEADIGKLAELGISAVFPVGSPLDQVVAGILHQATVGGVSG